MKRRLAIAALFGWSLAALAEPPMTVDDAGTLDQGGAKVEGAWRHDDRARSVELLFGIAPFQGWEVGILGTVGRDTVHDPSDRLRGTGLVVKWVPVRNEVGWSLGLSYGYASEWTKVVADPPATRTQIHRLTALATYRMDDSQVIHGNLGAKKVIGEARVATWGIGYEYPITPDLKLTAEWFGEESSRPDKAVGLRYTLGDGVKVSAAVGRGNGRTFGQAGFAWEF